MKRAAALVTVNILVFVLLAELLGLVAYYYDTGALFYVHRPPSREPPALPPGMLTADALHPYFGPTHRPGVRPETNNFGFGSPYAYPFERTSADQFIIGIFGGSVGRWFCDLGVPRLVERLKASAFLASKQIVPLCFSHEGYKQPQQLILTAFFLSIGQSFDLVINIDGFNEVALGSLNPPRGLDISMPSPLHLEPIVNLIDRSTLTPERLRSLAAIEGGRERLRALASWMRANRLASVNFVLQRLYDSMERQYRFELGRFASLPGNSLDRSLVQVTAAVKPRAGEAIYRDIASQWVEASLLMHDLLQPRSIAYVHVLQPNQYFTKRRFSEAEARVARSAASPFRAAVEQGYPALLAAAERLKGRVSFFSAIDLFDREPGQVYQDDCCHYTERGNFLLADFLADRIMELLTKRQSGVVFGGH
jgi:hypothetical protein